jgi:hypothetical protein
MLRKIAARCGECLFRVEQGGGVTERVQRKSFGSSNSPPLDGEGAASGVARIYISHLMCGRLSWVPVFTGMTAVAGRTRHG